MNSPAVELRANDLAPMAEAGSFRGGAERASHAQPKVAAPAESVAEMVPALLAAEFDRLAPSLHRWVKVRVGRDGHLADDILQQLWVALQRNGRSVPPSQIEFWLRGVARNLVTTYWRRQGSRPAHVPVASPALAGELADKLGNMHLPPETLARREVQDQLMLAITELDAEDQDLIVAHYFRGQQQIEIAAKLGVSARAIEGRLYRARQNLRERLRGTLSDQNETDS